jgi:hypothetical protein
VQAAPAAAAPVTNGHAVASISTPFVQVSPPPVVGTMPSGTPVTMADEMPELVSSTEERVYGLICAYLQGGNPLRADEAMIGWARGLVAKLEG